MILELDGLILTLGDEALYLGEEWQSIAAFGAWDDLPGPSAAWEQVNAPGGAWGN